MARALVIVDVQGDFLPGGALAVQGGDEIVDRIGEQADKGGYDFVVATADWHPADHSSFAAEPEFKDGSWPAHCVKDTDGALIHLPLGTAHEVFTKGSDKDTEAYSGFDGVSLTDWTLLGAWLEQRGVTEIDVVGLALDYCVKATALDGANEGFKTRVLRELTRPVSENNVPDVRRELADAGVEVV